MKILAAIDHSEQSETLLTTVKSMNWPEGTEINLFTSIKGPKPKEGRPLHKEEQLVIDLLGEKAQRLQNLLPHCRIFYDIAHGEPKETIIKEARRWSANLIVLGTRGHRGLELLLTGSVSQHVMLHAGCPVMILKPHLKDLAQELNDGFESVLIPVDGSIFSRATVQWLANLGFARNTRFKLVTAVKEVSETMLSTADFASVHLSTMAQVELQEMAQPLIEAFGRENVTTQVHDGTPDEVIMAVAENWQADLIVLGSHGKTGFTRLLMGSVSQSVAGRAPCSVAIAKGVLSQAEYEALEKEMEQPNNKDEGYGDYRPHVPPYIGLG
ncbi:MAG: universal stress protein [Candidatus Melainabacteria bacterium]|nr:universal stress protein [Candidatus Melainabacteria bacterium]